MSSLGSLLNVAGGGMMAQAAALDLVGQNISNANTPGYVRRTANLETRALGSNQSGGVVYSGPLRMVDRFANARVFSALGMRGAASSRSSALSGLESGLTPSTGGIGDRMNALFAAAQDVASNAADPAARSAFLAKAEDTATSFRTAAQSLDDRRAELVGTAGSVSDELNTRLTKVATMNQQIASAQALGEPANDLRDQRDQLIGEIGERMGVQAIEEPNGMMTLLSSGTALVDGNTAGTVGVSLDGAGALEVTVQRGSGAPTDVTQNLAAGQLAGIREARDVDIPKLQTKLDQLAFDYAGAMNAAHSAGFGLDGVSGRNLFSAPATVAGAAAAFAVDPSVKGQPDRVAASSTAADVPAGNGAALAMVGVASQAIGAGGTPSERFGGLGADLGTVQSAADSDLALRTDTADVATSMRDQGAGVSVEEEMVNLTRYQRAFEASQRVLSVANELLDGLIKGL